jgi:hypothetical protein
MTHINRIEPDEFERRKRLDLELLDSIDVPGLSPWEVEFVDNTLRRVRHDGVLLTELQRRTAEDIQRKLDARGER